MNKKVLVIILLSFNIIVNSQDSTIFISDSVMINVIHEENEYNPLSAPNTYQNKDNPNYWKNKMPYKDYWQQDVYYKIKARINEKDDIIYGEQELTYTNNSPDTLNFVYFHLYQNAFQPESYLDKLQKGNNKNPKYGVYESQKLGTEIDYIKINEQELKTTLDNTILKVYLPNALTPNSSVVFNINFKTYFDQGDVRRRMAIFNSWGYKHYNGVHWYPRISVYDAKFGWTTDQHLGKEFYGNFGCFDVELTFASNFIVEATGFLTNRNEVLPKELRERLDIKNFKDKEWNSPPSTIIEYKENETKTWKFHAENVHDFAFTADPTYRIGESWWEDKVCYSLVQEPHASKWQNAASFGAECLKVFSEDFGRYVYHKVIVADARSGMEYPMITLDGGIDPSYRDLLAHEIGHMWFFGQVGNNETYRALLDEGFTQFLTAWAMIKIDGEYVVEDKETTEELFYRPFKAIDREIYFPYIMDATKKNDPVISTHSDGFNGALRHGGGYRHVYYKTASMLYNLQYVLGDDLFLDAMKNYFNTWKIAHPYNEDFRNSIIRYTKVDLNWFFDQWLETEKTIDYSVKTNFNKRKNKHKIKFKRKARMQMPIDFQILANNGEKYNYHIPNNWFIKKTDAKILDKWHGWDLINPTYTAYIDKIPSGIDQVIIDPTNRLADAYMVDNNSKFNVKYDFLNSRTKYDWKNYQINYSPVLGWNDYDGIRIGAGAFGGYLKHHHLFRAKILYNSGALQRKNMTLPNDHDILSYDTEYKTNLDNISLNSTVHVKSKFSAGLHTNQLSLDKKSDNKKYKFNVNFLSLYRTNKEYLYNSKWQKSKLNNRINISIEKKYNIASDNDIDWLKGGRGNIKLTLQSSSLGSDFNYNKIIIEDIRNQKIGKLRIKNRDYLQIGIGTKWAEESKLLLAGANEEEMLLSGNYLFEADGIVSREIKKYGNTTNNFHANGGLNIRGYSGYLAPQVQENGDTLFYYNGKSGWAWNLEVDITSYLPKKLRFPKSYLFMDLGYISQKTINSKNIFKRDTYSKAMTDAGIGFAISSEQFGLNWTERYFANVWGDDPLIVRFDIPFYLNNPPNQEEKFQFRWLLGLTYGI